MNVATLCPNNFSSVQDEHSHGGEYFPFRIFGPRTSSSSHHCHRNLSTVASSILRVRIHEISRKNSTGNETTKELTKKNFIAHFGKHDRVVRTPSTVGICRGKKRQTRPERTSGEIQQENSKLSISSHRMPQAGEALFEPRHHLIHGALRSCFAFDSSREDDIHVAPHREAEVFMIVDSQRNAATNMHEGNFLALKK